MAAMARTSEAVPELSETIQVAEIRKALRGDLEAARLAYQGMMASISDSQWQQKAVSSAWTWREVMQHLAWAVEQLPDEVASARKGKGMFNYPGWLANPASYWITRWESRAVTRQSLLRRYDAAIDAVLRTLDEVPDGDWMKSAAFYGHSLYTVVDLFRTPLAHLEEHSRGFVAH